MMWAAGLFTHATHAISADLNKTSVVRCRQCRAAAGLTVPMLYTGIGYRVYYLRPIENFKSAAFHM